MPWVKCSTVQGQDARCCWVRAVRMAAGHTRSRCSLLWVRAHEDGSWPHRVKTLVSVRREPNRMAAGHTQKPLDRRQVWTKKLFPMEMCMVLLIPFHETWKCTPATRKPPRGSWECFTQGCLWASKAPTEPARQPWSPWWGALVLAPTWCSPNSRLVSAFFLLCLSLPICPMGTHYISHEAVGKSTWLLLCHFTLTDSNNWLQ